jgi:hypothetical protein
MLNAMSTNSKAPYSFAFEWFSPGGPLGNGLDHDIDISRHHLDIQWYLDKNTPVIYGRFCELLKVGQIPHRNIPVSALDEDGQSHALFVVEPNRDGMPLWGLGDSRKPQSFLNSLSPGTIEKLQRGLLKLLIYFGSEGFDLVKNGFHQAMHDELIKWGISSSDVTLVTGNFKEPDSYKKWISLAGFEPIHIFCYPHFEFYSQYMYKSYKQDLRSKPMFATINSQLQFLALRKKSHRYLCYNRLPKTARLAMGCALLSKKLISEGLFSFPKMQSRPEGESSFKDFFSEAWLTPWVQTLEKHRADFESRLPLSVDVEELSSNWAYSDGVNRQAEFAWPYEETFFSIVNETWTDADSVFLSEKIFKPIVNFHPFLVFGNPGTLAHLRTLGYKTFHPLIDEAYDSELDAARRLQMIVVAVEKLCKMTIPEITAWYLKLLPRLEHNQAWFFSENAGQRFQRLLTNHENLYTKENVNENWIYRLRKIGTSLRRGNGTKTHGHGL